MTKKRLAEIGGAIFVIYFAMGLILSIYFDYELISEKGFWAYLWRGDDHGMYHILLWPFYI